jgi:transposase
MYEAMDFFQEHAEVVEKSVFIHTANLFNLEVDLIFYDTTTASFAIDEEDEEDEETGEAGLRRYGKSKEGTWSPQVVIALAVTREGLPVRCWVFPGNTADAVTVERVRRDLRGWKLGRALFVADCGMNSEDNRKELGRACGKYLLASRMASVSEVKREVLGKRGRYTVLRDNLHAKEVIVGDGEKRRRYILCYNPKEAERQRRHRKDVVAILERELKQHSNRKATTQWAIEILASLRYKRYLRITKEGDVVLNRKAIAGASRYDGKWVIETNDDTISYEDAACGYKGLMVIEQCFRSLKRSQLKMSPMYHWAPRRIESHIRICVLSLLIQRAAEISSGKSWHQTRKLLRELQVSEYQTDTHNFFRRNEVSAVVKSELTSLEIPVPKHVLEITPTPKTNKNV